METLIGKTLQGGKYTLNAELGRGGFGITYRATHHLLNRVVVIKTLSEAACQGVNYADDLRKFQDEARRLALCVHPNIVRVSDFFIEENRAYMVMDYIPGPTLEAVVFPNNPLPEATALHYIRQIASALRVVHQNGLLHRDIKPQNIILRHDSDQVVLIDFGIAREFTPGFTQTHTNLISSGYAPVEQYIAKEKRTSATDVYGLAATLYSLLTAEIPVASILRDRQPMSAPRDLRPELSPAINQAVLRGLALDTHQRPNTVDEWLALLPNGQSLPANPTRQPPPAPSIPPPKRTEATVAISPRNPYAGQFQPTEATSAVAVEAPPKPRRSPNLRPIWLLLCLSFLTLSGVTLGAFWFKFMAPVPQQPSPDVASSPAIAESPSPLPAKPTASPSPKPSPSAEQSPQAEPTQPPEENEPTQVRPIPGFPTGTPEGEIKASLGEPSKASSGIWANTRTAQYELVPNQVTLAYIYDRTTNKVRQTEVSFAQSVDLMQIKVALNNMGAPADALDQIQRVYQRQANEYSFTNGNLKGIIQRNNQDRIYIGIWEADLHN